MEFNEKRLDFVRRTRDNLVTTEVWRKKHPDAAFHEVTQLVNSLVGLLILPKEMIHAINAPVEAEIQPSMSPTGILEWGVTFVLQPVKGRRHPVPDPGGLPPDLRTLVTGLRNAVAHYALEYGVDKETRQITSVTFQVRPWKGQDPPRPPWDATFTISQLITFVRRLAEEIEQVQEAARLHKLSLRPPRSKRHSPRLRDQMGNTSAAASITS